MAKSSTLKLVCFAVFLFSVSCIGRTPRENADGVLKNIWLGLRNYSETHGQFPPINGNVWRFSETTKYRLVPWRGLVLDATAALGTRDRSNEIERQIDIAGQALFSIGNRMTFINPNIYKWDSISRLPPSMVVVLAFEIESGGNWSDQDDIDLGRKLGIASQNDKLGETIFLLLADGSVESVPWTERHLIKLDRPKVPESE